MCNKTIFKLVSLCLLYNVVVFVLQPSPVTFGILTGILVGAAFIVGSEDGIDHTWKTIFKVQRQMEEEGRKMINRKD